MELSLPTVEITSLFGGAEHVDPDLVLDLAEERATIMEYEGEMSRRVAEKLAYDQAQTASHKLNVATTAR